MTRNQKKRILLLLCIVYVQAIIYGCGNGHGKGEDNTPDQYSKESSQNPQPDNDEKKDQPQSDDSNPSQKDEDNNQGANDNPNQPQSPCAEEVTFQAFTDVIDQHCVQCHSPNGIAASSDFKSLVTESQWTTSSYIEEDHLTSPIYFRLTGSSGELGPKNMPLGGELNEKELCIIKSFIEKENNSDPNEDPGEPTFSFKSDHEELLPFSSRLNKVIQFFQSSGALETDFSELLELRYTFGDHNYASNIPEQKKLGKLHHELWITTINKLCSTLPSKGSFKNDFAALIKKALGREPTPRDQTIFDDISGTNHDSNKKLQLSCTIVLSSIEFLGQSTTSVTNYTPRTYLERLAGTMVSRSLLDSELKSIKEQEWDSVRETISYWTTTKEFEYSIAEYISLLTRTGGSDPDYPEIDFNNPQKLTLNIHKQGGSYDEIISSNTCQSGSVFCDSSAPSGAGLLTTRAFLKIHGGPYNIARANKLMKYFACSSYPVKYYGMSETGGVTLVDEPRLRESELIHPFNQRKMDGFGNGSDCYLCHGQFGKHTQLFVKFDYLGMHRELADGIENPKNQSGFSRYGTFTSHLSNPLAASSSRSNFFGTDIENLNEAMKILADNEVFWQCAVKNVLGHYMRIPKKQLNLIDKRILNRLVKEHNFINKKPSFSELVIKVMSDQMIIDQIKDKRGS